MEDMAYRKGGQIFAPLHTFLVNGVYKIGVYEGGFSPCDILIKYKAYQDGRWTRLRTPKHIHWAVDILLKMQGDKALVQDFLSFLLARWRSCVPLETKRAREELSLSALLEECRQEIGRYEALGKRGEYSVRFLTLLARLLMIQEKTNDANAYMFEKLLEALRRGDDIFRIVSVATHSRRR